MKIDIKPVLDKIAPLSEFLRKYFKLLFFLGVAGLLAYLLLQINLLANSEPTPEEVSAKLLEVRKPRVDEDTVKIVEDLQDNSSQVRAIFNEARDNPFAEE